MVMRVSVSTGLPPSLYGEYRHCLAAVSASSRRSGLPLSTLKFRRTPSIPIVALRTTSPDTPARRAISGYLGRTFLTSLPSVTPCDWIGLSSGVGVFAEVIEAGSVIADRLASRLTAVASGAVSVVDSANVLDR